MSAEASAWAALRRTGSPLNKLVLVMIADFVGPNGHASVSLAAIAKQCEMSSDEVVGALIALQGHGFAWSRAGDTLTVDLPLS